MAGNPARKGGKKNRAHGRNKVKCAHYRAHRAVPNKIKSLEHHLKLFPDDQAARDRLLEIRRGN